MEPLLKNLNKLVEVEVYLKLHKRYLNEVAEIRGRIHSSHRDLRELASQLYRETKDKDIAIGYKVGTKEAIIDVRSPRALLKLIIKEDTLKISHYKYDPSILDKLEIHVPRPGKLRIAYKVHGETLFEDERYIPEDEFTKIAEELAEERARILSPKPECPGGIPYTSLRTAIEI